MMNPEAQEIFDRLVRKNPDELTPEDIAFLRARISYLSPLEKKEFSKILKPSKDEKSSDKSKKSEEADEEDESEE